MNACATERTAVSAATQLIVARGVSVFVDESIAIVVLAIALLDRTRTSAWRRGSEEGVRRARHHRLRRR